MIIIRLMGGIGNQLFQYSCAYALAKKHQTMVVPEISFYDINQQIPPFINNADHYRAIGMNDEQILGEILQNYRLDSFDLSQKIAPIKLPPKDNMELQVKIGADSQKIRVAYKQYNGNLFEPEILHLPDNTMLRGYFESFYYFKGLESELTAQFRLLKPLSARAQHYAQMIDQCADLGEMPIALSIRLGDKMAVKSLWLDCRDYVGRATKLAIELAKARGLKPRIFLFTADWANLRVHYGDFLAQYQPQIVEVITESALYDFEIIKKCTATIMTISTFVWWAAFCNQIAHKIVIAPSITSGGDYPLQSGTNRIDHYPEDWILLPINRF